MPSPALGRYIVRARRTLALAHFESAVIAERRARRRRRIATLVALLVLVAAALVTAQLYVGIPPHLDFRLQLVPLFLSVSWWSLAPPILVVFAAITFVLGSSPRLEVDRRKLQLVVAVLRRLETLSDDGVLRIKLDFRDLDGDDGRSDWLTIDGAFARGGRYALRVVERSGDDGEQTKQIFVELRPAAGLSDVATVATRLETTPPAGLTLVGVTWGRQTARAVLSVSTVDATVLDDTLTWAARALVSPDADS